MHRMGLARFCHRRGLGLPSWIISPPCPGLLALISPVAVWRITIAREGKGKEVSPRTMERGLGRHSPKEGFVGSLVASPLLPKGEALSSCYSSALDAKRDCVWS